MNRFFIQRPMDGLYSRGESNPYLKFRKLLFYPLNYRSNLNVIENRLQRYDL